MKLRKNAIKPLRLNVDGALQPNLGIEPARWQEILLELERIRDDMSDSNASTEIASINRPVFVSLPSRLLNEYEKDRRGSDLGRLFKRATHLHSVVDRVVVIGIGHRLAGARSILDTCCQPFWNELSRADRGSKPRIVFDDSMTDNDALQGLLHLLDAHKHRPATCELDRWALVAIGECGDLVSESVAESVSASVAESVALQRLLAALERSNEGSLKNLTDLFLPVMQAGNHQAQQIAFPDTLNQDSVDTFEIPNGVQGGFSLFSLAGLVPAALLGVNVIELLQGASAMTQHFKETPASSNVVLQFAALNHLLRTQHGIAVRVMSVWNKSLESFGQWYSELVAERLGLLAADLQSITILNPRDSHRYSLDEKQSEIKQPDLASNHRVFHQIYSSQVRFDPLANTDGQFMPGLLQSQYDRSVHALATANGPFTALEIPCVDELHMGQVYQMMMLATELEARLK